MLSSSETTSMYHKVVDNAIILEALLSLNQNINCLSEIECAIRNSIVKYLLDT
jgi:hypothetical protein